MDIFAVDLTSPRLFQEWYLQQIEDGATPLLVIRELEEVGSTAAQIQALGITYRAGLLSEYDVLLKHCLTAGEPLAAETAKGYTIYQRSVRVLQQGGPHMRVRLAEMQGALAWARKTLLQLPQSDLAVEGQVGILISTCFLLVEERKYQEAIETASQALFLAEQLQAPITIARARTMLISCTSNAGYAVSTIKMVEDDRRQLVRHSAHYIDMSMASALFKLGNFDEGASVMNDLIARTTGGKRTRALEFLQRTEALWGIRGLDGPTYETPLGSAPLQWMTEVARSLMRAYAVPREGKEADERAAHLLRVIEVCGHEEVNGTPWDIWDRLFAQWIVATAHLGRGEFTDAAGVLEHAERTETEWLDIRVLILGAALEVSLSWHAPSGFSAARYEQLLRQVFAEAAQNRYASPVGLARLLHRWHPTAAAYLALVPQPVLACAFATRSIMKVGQSNFVDDLTIPPVYACDLTLRALDFDLRRDFTFVQGDAGSSRKKKKELIQLYGDVPVWRLPVSPVKLAYGMMRHQSQEYQDRAKSILQTYGIRPMTSALYEMIGVLDQIEEYTKELIGGDLTPKGFATKMSALTR